jgi:predicted deacylase
MLIPNRPWESLAAGETWRGGWETGNLNVPALPVLAARGIEDGPTLLVTGGVHGDEYEGPAAIHALFEAIDTAALRGRLIAVPVVHVAAWEARLRVSPADGQNLNRLFPGPPTAPAGPTEALAQVVFDMFVRACDVLIDLHSGGAALVHLPMIGWYVGEEGVAKPCARQFGGGLHPWIMPDVPGVLSYEAHRAGKTALGAEWGGGARLDLAGVAAYTSGLRRVLSLLAMLPAPLEMVAPDERPPLQGDYQETTQGGLFVPCVALGDRVTQGAPLGVLRDAPGNVIAEVRAERTGMLAALPHIALLRPGDRIAYIG